MDCFVISQFAERKIQTVAEGIDANIEFNCMRSVPGAFNHPEQTKLAVAAPRSLVGPASVKDWFTVSMGAEDFAYMLQNGQELTSTLVTNRVLNVVSGSFDFDDEPLPYGIGWAVKLVETTLVH
ncbi:hypothetical protein EN759_26200 [Mesorhizobium sp. M00.F.Ca.ET.038.03.1.1]|nr:hypothetical protein EN759_26200 [Mesorhizobium sp. M00.F.Ca.ET.038.03.1.1]